MKKGERTTPEDGPQAANLGVRKRLVKEAKRRTNRGRRGRPEMGSEEVTLAAAEHA